MYLQFKKSYKYVILSFVILILLSYLFSKCSFASNEVRVILDGKEFVSDEEEPKPFIENGRTLIPIRFISEKLGAEVDWNPKDRTVTINKGKDIVRLQIDSHLVTYKKGNTSYGLTDVAPRIIEGRTFVPLRLVSNALGVGIEWNQNNRTVSVDSSQKSDIEPFFDVNITSFTSGEVVSGKTKLKIDMSEEYKKDADHIQYLLLSPDTLDGFVIAQGENLNDEYTWIPDLREKGNRILVAAIYDKSGELLAGDARGVNIDVNPKVTLTGVKEGQTLENNISLGVDTNFVSTRVEYEIVNSTSGSTSVIGKGDTPQDPYGEYSWNPNMKDNGQISIKATAYDTNGIAHESNVLNAIVEVEPKLSLSGVSQGQTIDKPVTLMASRNFDVNTTRYILIDNNTGEESIIAEKPYGGHEWFPGDELKGTKDLLVEVVDSQGLVRRSEPIQVNVLGKPILLLDGIGPNQVVTGTTSLSTRSNVDLDSVKYVIVNKETGEEKEIANNNKPNFELDYVSASEDGGEWHIKAISQYKGEKIASEEIPYTIYLGDIYEPVSIVNSDNYVDEFIKLSSDLAVKSWEDTGMSAALQAAQSIQETGWGRSVPVDKYSGKISYNLFGIKGEGPEGSIVSNTWEVYNGKTYRVDANFRAYSSIEESWKDHKTFLLNRDRYEPFKEVMQDYVQGAWALKRSGYATDPEYATKLMRLIEQYNLRELDRVKI